MRPDELRTRILLWAKEQIRINKLPPKSGSILEALLYRGELPRANTPAVVDSSARSARRVVSSLLEHGVLTSESTRTPLGLAFPATHASRWMPGISLNELRSAPGISQPPKSAVDPRNRTRQYSGSRD